MTVLKIGGVNISEDEDKIRSNIARYLEIVRAEADERDVLALVNLIIVLSKKIGCGYLESSARTSMEELKALQNRGYVAQCKKLVIVLREAKDNNSMKGIHIHDVRYINECLGDLYFKPEAVGTTVSEMEIFEREALIAEAKENLEKARENKGEDVAFSYLKLVMKTLARRERDISFEDVGTDLEEIDQLQRI